jgi:hypothetical protein
MSYRGKLLIMMKMENQSMEREGKKVLIQIVGQKQKQKK